MIWNDLHGIILAKAFHEILGDGESGSIAFVRCLLPEVVAALANDPSFTLPNWDIWRVADADDPELRSIKADRAVELREEKRNATLLLVDTLKAGAGMDGIYSAAREVDEQSLFKKATGLAAREITKRRSSNQRKYAERAVKKARGYGRQYSISSWTEYDFLVRIAGCKDSPGALLYLLGLWPATHKEEEGTESVDLARNFVDRLLGSAVSGFTPAARIQALRLFNPSEAQLRDLEAFLWSASTKPLFSALDDLSGKPHLWVNALRIEGADQSVQAVNISSWRTRTDQVVKWSGLIAEGPSEEAPVFIMKPDADKTGEYSKLEIRWKTRPDNLEKGAVEYRVAIMSDMEEELTFKEIMHAAKREQRCRFTNDDFIMLSEDALINAKVVISVVGNDSVESQETEEFVIRFGHPPGSERSGLGKTVRTFSEGLIELESREIVSAIASSSTQLSRDTKGFMLLRTPQRGKSYRVFQPSLIHEVEQQWIEQSGAVGRWQVKVRASGARACIADFVPLSRPVSVSEDKWNRAAIASARMADRFASCGGGVGQIYDENAERCDGIVKEYLHAWSELFEEGIPLLALVNTVEIQSLSGRTIGLIVLPSHPLRVCWHSAYDNLVLHAAFQQGVRPKELREEFVILDGSMFPAILPGLEQQTSFVFADTLGFHAVGMVPDSDKEPKAAIALLARALSESNAAETSPTIGKGSAQILGNEIFKYIECHASSKSLHIHALRPGDGLTVARSLGDVQKRYEGVSDGDENEFSARGNGPSFVLELYPSEEQRGISGRFISEAREKRRSGAGVLSENDRWMLESLSLPGGVSLPKLRWARKRVQNPETAAHLAIAFDTFESNVICEDYGDLTKGRPYYSYGLLSFFDRFFTSNPSPRWSSVVPFPTDGEKHPSDRMHTDRLLRLQEGIMKCVVQNLSGQGTLPVLTTEISTEKAQSLKTLHGLCDWVITLDRNAGIEYFDSPLDNRDIYDAYVIDCVPEREDLGCLQLITSTSNLDEVRGLLDEALDQMGLSRSLRNAQFLLENLKSLSGRLAIRLTGQKAPTSELIALAVSHANCWRTAENSACWVSLQDGFFIPVDDVRDLLPPLRKLEKNEEERAVRPDLIHVSILPRKGLLFRFIEVKYRRHLRSARNPVDLNQIREQTESLRKRWQEWYVHDAACSSFRAIRRAKLARVLRFYADKAHRHSLPKDRYDALVSEIDRMVAKGAEYIFPEVGKIDRGWVFCPEYSGNRPLLISPEEWNASIFLFGPSLLPDSTFRVDFINRQEISPREPTREEPKQDPSRNGTEMVKESDIRLKEISTEEHTNTELEIDSSAHEITGEIIPAVYFGKDVLTEADVRLELKVKGNPHLLVAGLPGMGKTTCLLNLCKQMLQAGIRPILFSYHEDIDEKMKSLVDSVRFIDFNGLGFNPLHILDRRNRMAYLDVASALRDIFFAIFPDLGDIQGKHIRQAIKESFVEAGWDTSANDYTQLREPEFKRFLEILKADPKPDRGLRTLLARFEELEDYGFFELAEDQQSLWESDLPIVIRIHTTLNDTLQKAFASLVLYGLYKDMFRRGLKDTITHAVVFDEAHRAAGLALIPTMAKECRKYGIALILASQEAKDFNVSLFSAIANYLVLRLTEADAKALVRNVASSQQERTLIDKIKQMDRFKALYFCEGKSRPAYVALSA